MAAVDFGRKEEEEEEAPDSTILSFPPVRNETANNLPV